MRKSGGRTLLDTQRHAWTHPSKGCRPAQLSGCKCAGLRRPADEAMCKQPMKSVLSIYRRWPFRSQHTATVAGNQQRSYHARLGINRLHFRLVGTCGRSQARRTDTRRRCAIERATLCNVRAYLVSALRHVWRVNFKHTKKDSGTYLQAMKASTSHSSLTTPIEITS